MTMKSIYAFILLLTSLIIIQTTASTEQDKHAPGENVEPPPRRKLKDKKMLQQVTAAVAKGEMDVLKKLVEEDNADVNAKDMYSVSLLHMVSIRCNPEIMTYLIEQGADVNAQLTNVAGHRAGETPLHFAASSRQKECVKVLIDKGSNIAMPAREGLTPMHIAAGVGYPDILKIFIDSGADINIEASNDYGSLPIHLAATSGDFESVKLLVDHGAIITTPNKLNATALHGAAATGSVDIVEYLLARGLDKHKHILNKDKQTALEVAISRSNYSEEVKKVLPKLKALLTGDESSTSSSSGSGSETRDNDNNDDEDVIEISEESEYDDTENADL